ncbi:ABC transporter substrate-binding protein [Clostridium sporogenes]|uniref:Ferrichrome ABC transporter substrate-binding protein n=1 Tax=Clostridium botulinum TaxID=1491 RepID=A0A6M0SXS4_CLOBO|nr:ABC transporter substrate-binding protein [Clostridium sporogenes]NFA59903.1 ferrichrome ABC transporter substrate-binding protein [Clostridium botulinum]NFI74024.1 ferrichrome ABC transporter substrate-binding protein [Clostridium sporogenes]NFL71738.1 ferrichrome ABC transporter substrate-binding protein [Clostridium sporogenes]NFM24594.1 ferrichrome ABC transporter substrate-binding protein [Clostridium sporogenes]NFP61898.1 ferrichrome ABC transporter substrate-binding protein [Clostrid
MGIKKLKITFITCLILIFSALAVGCSKSTSTNSEEKSNKDHKTRTISTVMGKVEVPANPKRIIVNYFQGDLLALGVKPLAMSSMEGDIALKNELKGVKIVEKWEPEEIMALKPDLIIVISEEEYKKYNKIAPTIFLPFTKISSEERLTLIGEAVGKQEEAKKVINNFKNKVETSKKKLETAGVMDKSFTLLEQDKKEIMVLGNKWGRGGEIVYDYLGLKAPNVVKKEIINGDQYKNVSLEAFPEYSGDYIIQSVWNYGVDNLKDNNVWSNLPAVKENRVIKTDGNLFYYMDLYSMDKQLDYIVNSILKTTKK